MSASELSRRELERAVADRELLALVTPVMAAGFGVLPLRRRKRTLTVASYPRPNRKALRALAHILGHEIAVRPCPPNVLGEYLERAYFGPGREGVNFHTFLDPDFLEKPKNWKRLVEEKTEDVGEAISTLPEWDVVFLDIDYRSRLTDLDSARRPSPPFRGGKLDLAFRRKGEAGVIAFDPLRVEPEDFLVVQAYDFRDGVLFDHGITTKLTRGLPHMIHPTEVQVVRVGPDGTLEFWLYDRFLQVAPGARPTFQIAYHYLSYGHRQRRTLSIKIRDLFVVDRHAIEYHDRQPEWSGGELGRWFGL